VNALSSIYTYNFFIFDMPATVNSYEATFILGEEATEEQAKAKVTELTTMLEEFGGKVTKTELWGLRELAYVIKRNRNGFYTTLWIDLPATQVLPFERQLRFDESIIRSLVTTAYTSAQPGSLYPVVEEEKSAKPARTRRGETEETAGAEEELRRTSTKRTASVKEEMPEGEEEISEEERLKKLDESLDVMLKDEAN
jgi:small subunit ribosomal protein S6